MASVAVVGMGPGDGRYLTVAAKEVLGGLDHLAGWASALELAGPWTGARMHELTYATQTAVLEELAEAALAGARCGVSCWGDPSVSERQLIERLLRAGLDPVIVPGISSIQLAAVRAEMYLDESVVVTFHKAGDIEPDKRFLVSALRSGRGALALPRPRDFTPREMADFLMAAGVSGGRGVLICERLSLPEERLVRLNLGELAVSGDEYSDLTVVAIPKEYE